MMSQPRVPRPIPFLALLVLVTALAACGQRTEAPGETTAAGTEAPAVEQTPAGNAEAAGQLLAILEAADAYDGETDQIIAKCPACNLGMEGSADNALHVRGYELRFCSEGCKKRFEENTEEALLAMKIPES